MCSHCQPHNPACSRAEPLHLSTAISSSLSDRHHRRHHTPKGIISLFLSRGVTLGYSAPPWPRSLPTAATTVVKDVPATPHINQSNCRLDSPCCWYCFRFHLKMSNHIVGEVYQTVIEEVINSSRVDFEENGVEESVLEELRKVSERLSSFLVLTTMRRS